MNEQIASDEIARLERLVGDDPGATGFAALAEAHRRAGRPEHGERIARTGLERRPDAVEGRVALGLALLDLGRLEDARAELERVLGEVPDHPLAAGALGATGSRPGSPPPPAPEALELLDRIDEPEIDEAFELAAPETDGPLTADRVAADALHAAELGDDEEGEADGAEGSDEIPVSTRTVADLLERQGHAEHARAMRSALGGDEPGRGGERERVLATLERWLDNLRRRNP